MTQTPAPTRPRTRILTRARRRAVLIVAAVVVLAVLVTVAGGGWLVSSDLEAQSVPQAHTQSGSVTITVEPGGRLAVKADAGQEYVLTTYLAGATTYGIGWEGGYGQVSGTPVSGTAADGAQSNGTLVKKFTLLQGTAPAAGTPAYVDGYAYPNADPAVALGAGGLAGDAAATVANVTYSDSAGTFDAYLAKPGATAAQEAYRKGATWAILVHGANATRADMFRLMRSTVAAGMPTLDISYRNDTGEPKDPSGHLQFGATEWHELAAAAIYAKAHGATRLVLAGNSMGGAIVASYLRHRAEGTKDAQGAPVISVILDSPLLDFEPTAQLQARATSFPVFGSPPVPLVWVGLRFAQLRFGFDPKALDYIDGTTWVTMPVLIVHGTFDGTVPLATSERLAAKYPKLVRVDVVQGGQHTLTWNSDPAAYESTVAALFAAVH